MRISLRQCLMLALTLSAAGCDCGTTIDSRLAPTIAFTDPVAAPGSNPPVAPVAGLSTVSVKVTSHIPLASVFISFDNGLPIAQWVDHPTGETFQQTVNWELTLGPGMHELKAIATDNSSQTATATLEVVVAAPAIAFTSPTVTAGTTQAVVNIAGTSPVAVNVTAYLPLTTVAITCDNGVSLVAWAMNPVGPAFSQIVNWNSEVGPGPHHLTASATDSAGQTATATLDINVETPSIVFTQPIVTSGTSPPTAEVDAPSQVAVQVTSLLPLTSVVITYDSGQPLAQWTTNPTGPTFQQAVSWATTLGSGTHQLKAVAMDSGGERMTASLTVEVQVLSIAFTQPVITPGTSPAVSEVVGASPLEVTVSSALPLTSVVVTYDSGLPLADWSPSPVGPTFQQTVAWAPTMGRGDHLLTAVATDSHGGTAAATLEISTALDPCGVENQSIVIVCPSFVAPACGACGSFTEPAETFNLAVIPISVSQNGGTFQDMLENNYSFDVSTCTLTETRYGPTTVGGKCNAPVGEAVSFTGTSGTITYPEICANDCSLCGNNPPCSASF